MLIILFDIISMWWKFKNWDQNIWLILEFDTQSIHFKAFDCDYFFTEKSCLLKRKCVLQNLNKLHHYFILFINSWKSFCSIQMKSNYCYERKKKNFEKFMNIFINENINQLENFIWLNFKAIIRMKNKLKLIENESILMKKMIWLNYYSWIWRELFLKY